MSINTFPAVPQGRQPRSVVMVNDYPLPFVDWEVVNNNYYQADTFQIHLPYYGLQFPTDAAWLSQQTTLKVEVYAGFPANPDNYSVSELDRLILGTVDEPQFDPAHGAIGLSGRDLTSIFIDTKTIKKWPNLTASAIIEKLASEAGIGSVVENTTTKVGSYYNADHAHLTASRTEWDLMTYLAHKEDKSLFVSGDSVHFVSKVSLSDDPYVIDWHPADSHNPILANVSQLSMSRNLTLAKDIVVRVHSWNMQQMQGFTRSATATHNVKTAISGLPQPVGHAQVYTYSIPNLLPEQALQKAQSLLRQLSRHELTITATLPADQLLNTQMPLLLQGTGTVFDQTYHIDQVTRTFDLEQGYTMALSAKNHPTESYKLA